MTPLKKGGFLNAKAQRPQHFLHAARSGGVTPPPVQEGIGWISGVVYDSGTCNAHLTTCQGLAGMGTVDENGDWVVVHMLHFSMHDVNYPPPPPPVDGEAGGDGDPPPPPECVAGEQGCFIGLKSGQVREGIELPALNVLGQATAPRLSYSTGRADPSQVIDVALDLSFDPNYVQAHDYVQFELYIEGQKTDQFTFEANLSQDGELVY